MTDRPWTAEEWREWREDVDRRLERVERGLKAAKTEQRDIGYRMAVLNCKIGLAEAQNDRQ